MELLNELVKFGLLGLILGWLALVHLPAKDIFIKEMVLRSDKRLDDVVESFKQDLESVINHCQQENKAVLERIDRLTALLSERLR